MLSTSFHLVACPPPRATPIPTPLGGREMVVVPPVGLGFPKPTRHPPSTYPPSTYQPSTKRLHQSHSNYNGTQKDGYTAHQNDRYCECYHIGSTRKSTEMVDGRHGGHKSNRTTTTGPKNDPTTIVPSKTRPDGPTGATGAKNGRLPVEKRLRTPSPSGKN